jgi:class 3 adenylate cyclase
VHVLLVNLEVMLLSLALVGLYALRPRLGLAPLYMSLGLLLAFMSVSTRLLVPVAVPGGGSALYGSINHLAVLLTGLVLVYALEGTKEARRLVGGLVLISVGLFLLRFLLGQHIEGLGAEALSLHGRERWVAPRAWSSLVSTIALIVDGLCIVVLYQWFSNLTRRRLGVVSLSAALVLAMVLDGLIYGGLSGNVDWSGFGSHVLGKLAAGVAASIPAAAYITYQFHSYPDRLRGGVLERKAFEILDMRRELRSIRAALSKSRSEYEHVRSVFSRYVAPDVVDEILRDTSQLKLGGELREVTIVFSDIRGYSTLSEAMSPEATIELLNQYFGAMGVVIGREHGTIIEFEGDAILTVFGAPLNQPDHAARAVRTAIAMLRRVEELNQEWDRDGTSQAWRKLRFASFKIRIGIHTGPVVVGNVGSESRAKYAVIGDTVNTAARIESLNKKLRTTLLMSSTTADQIGGLGLDLVDYGEHGVRGRAEPVHLYGVREITKRVRAVRATTDVLPFREDD